MFVSDSKKEINGMPYLGMKIFCGVNISCMACLNLVFLTSV